MKTAKSLVGSFGPLLLLLLLLGTAGLTAAQEQPLSLADYRARLAQALDDLAAGDPPPDLWDSAPSVALPSGAEIQPHPLYTEESDPQTAKARLTAAVEKIDLSANDNSAARLAQLEAVAARLDLLQPSLWERFVRWLWDLIRRLLPERGPSVGGGLGGLVGTVTGWAVIAVGGLLGVLLFSYWLRRLLGGVLGGRAGDDPLALGDELPASAAQARSQAGLLAESGNYREAVRRLYLAALLRLRERELIRFESSQTNREVLAAIPPSSPARGHLEPVVETFDRVWYGVQEPDAQTFAAYSQEIDALLDGQPEVGRG